MIPAILESPYKGDIVRNVKYAQLCMHDMIVNHNEAPYASHLLYTQDNVLRDDVPEERLKGIQAGFVFRSLCQYSVFYADLGMTEGMKMAIEDCKNKKTPYEIRTLPENLLKLLD